MCSTFNSSHSSQMLRHQISIRSSCFSPTTLGACSKYRPIRFRRVCSARVAFPTARLHSLHAHAMSVGLLPGTPVLLTSCGRPSARQVPVLRGQVVRSAWRRLGSSVATANSTCRGSASHVKPESLYVTQRFNTVVDLSCPRPMRAFCTRSSFSFSFCDSHSRSSPDPRLKTQETSMRPFVHSTRHLHWTDLGLFTSRHEGAAALQFRATVHSREHP